MKTLTFPSNSIGSMLSDSTARPLPPIAIPRELAEVNAARARRTSAIDQQRHRYAIAGGIVAALVVLLYLAI